MRSQSSCTHVRGRTLTTLIAGMGPIAAERSVLILRQGRVSVIRQGCEILNERQRDGGTTFVAGAHPLVAKHTALILWRKGVSITGRN
mmetsp:Transcript_6059/g.14628  ORF Transcript_6059/g.14628 Transcript_6059/m.14628 type:complete len:88 (+) Transcript_6059:799-1062(+)